MDERRKIDRNRLNEESFHTDDGVSVSYGRKRSIEK